METEIKEIKEILTQIRICMAKLEVTQHERTKMYEDIKEDVSALKTKMNWATGVVAAIATIFSTLSSYILRKAGLS